MKTFEYVDGLPTLPVLLVEETEGHRHYVTPSGKYPSITTVLGHFKEKELASWKARVGSAEADRIKNRAGTKGTRFHEMVERYIRNDPNVLDGVMPDMIQAFRDIKPYLDQISPVYYQECALFSEELRVAGRVDIIAEFMGKLSIIDLKTSRWVRKEESIISYFEQATAYAIMAQERAGLDIEQIVILMQSADQPETQTFIRPWYGYVDGLKRKIETYYKEMD